MKLLVLLLALYAVIDTGTSDPRGRHHQRARGRRQKKHCPETCGDHERKVCDSDGNEYKNMCELKKADCADTAKDIRPRHCPNGKPRRQHQPACKEHCTKELVPVCGTDNITYANRCILGIAICKSEGKIGFKHLGKCEGSKGIRRKP